MTDTTPAAPAPETTPAPAPGSEEAALLDLYAKDQPTFEYSPTWRDTGQTASQRLYEIQQARGAQQDGAEKPDQQVAEQTDDLADADDIDLDAEADEPAEEVAEQTEEREPLKPWAPPEGQEVAEHVKPHLEALDGIVDNEKQRDEIVGLYQKLVEEQTTRLAEADKAAQKAAVETMGGKEVYAPIIDAAKAVLKSWPKELADAVRSARTSDGKRLALMPEFVRVLAAMDHRQGTPQPQDHRSMLQQELAELDAIRDRDVSELYRPWKNTGISGSDRALQIARELASEAPAKPSATDIRAEERRLEKLSRDDPQLFQFGSWPGARSPADRLHQIRTGRAA